MVFRQEENLFNILKNASTSEGQRLFGSFELMGQAMYHFGRYLMLLGTMFVSMERPAIYYHNTLRETLSMGIGSLPIVLVSSVFVGAVMTLNTSYQLTTGLFPNSIIGTVVSTTALMEFGPTVTSLLLAGKVGANIASQIGTMRVYEQVDALEVMGVNSASYLILPKILASLLAFPILIIIAAFLLHLGGLVAGEVTGEVNIGQFTAGVRQYYDEFQVTFMMIKSVTFGLVISTISSYQGFYVSGGPIEVGKASTRAVVVSSITILLMDFVLAQLLL